MLMACLIQQFRMLHAFTVYIHFFLVHSLFLSAEQHLHNIATQPARSMHCLSLFGVACSHSSLFVLPPQH